MSEDEMVLKGIKCFQKQSHYKWIKQEVPFLSRCIDVVLLDESDKLISVEFKIANWKHAIVQASDHKLGSDYAYICLPKRTITPALTDTLTNTGVGLMLFDDEAQRIENVISPNKNRNITAFRSMLLNNANHISSVDF